MPFLRRTPHRERVVAGRYVLLEELGRGASGVVRRARDLHTRTCVAAKLLGDAGARERFEHEAALRIEHPHVLTATDRVEDGATLLFTMPLAEGGSLRERLVRGRDEPRAMGQLLDALAAVHDAGVVHGDVKPANLLLHRDGRLLLADFGVATRLSEQLVAVGPVGTPAYLPPERRQGGAPHPSQDVYAAGVVGRLLVGSGPLVTLWDSMTRAEAGRRPTAREARVRLHELTGRR